MKTQLACSIRRPGQSGLTLVELMIALALGLLVAGAATALLLSTRAGYVLQDEDARLEDTGRYALESIARSLRQTAYEDWDASDAPIVTLSTMSANIAGLDAASLKASTPALDGPLSSSVNGSDVLATRFFGTGPSPNGDGAVVNCAGFGVGAPSNQGAAEAERGWSIYYVAQGSTGEPELYCKYRGASGWSAQAVARGVESLQFLYGLDTDSDGLVNRYLTANALNQLDDALVLSGATSEEQAADRNRKTNWKKVVVVRIALLLRGSSGTAGDRQAGEFKLFGDDYTAMAGAADKGTYIKESDLPVNVRQRPRRLFTTIVQLRNRPVAGSAG